MTLKWHFWEEWGTHSVDPPSSYPPSSPQAISCNVLSKRGKAPLRIRFTPRGWHMLSSRVSISKIQWTKIGFYNLRLSRFQPSKFPSREFVFFLSRKKTLVNFSSCVDRGQKPIHLKWFLLVLLFLNSNGSVKRWKHANFFLNVNLSKKITQKIYSFLKN